MRPTILILSLIILQIGCQSAHLAKASLFGSAINKDQSIHLFTIDKQELLVSDLALDKKGTVLIFWQRSCPCVRRYQQRVNTLFERYGEELAFFHVSSNTNESFSEVIKEYKRRNIPVPLLRDEGARLKRMLDVVGTPTAALLNNKGELLFLGWIDNERDIKEKGRKAYLEDAISHYLENKPIGVASSLMFGCRIFTD